MSPPGRTRILVVDDEPSILRFLRASLGRSGYEISEAHDGLQRPPSAGTLSGEPIRGSGLGFCQSFLGNPLLNITTNSLRSVGWVAQMGFQTVRSHLRVQGDGDEQPWVGRSGAKLGTAEAHLFYSF